MPEVDRFNLLLGMSYEGTTVAVGSWAQWSCHVQRTVLFQSSQASGSSSLFTLFHEMLLEL